MDFTLSPIGYIDSDYPDKFGVPRQPGLAPAASATLTLVAPYNDPLSVRGLEAVSHLWVSFIFHHNPPTWSPLVRPPRLGGNRKVGVFASRSPNRPNRLGLSLLALEHIDTQRGVRLTLASCDLVSGTPVVDIKPYLPWAEAKPEASAGFAPTPPPNVEVVFQPQARNVLTQRDDCDSLQALITQVLSQDPRPAYQRDTTSERTYGVRLRDVDVKFQAWDHNAADNKKATTLAVVAIEAV